MDPLISSAPLGCKISLVAYVYPPDDNGVIHAIGVSPQQSFSIQGCCDIHEGLYTFYGLIKATDDSNFDCHVTENTRFFLHPQQRPYQGLTVLDLCSGMGGFSLGSRFLGIPTCAFVDQNKMSCAALEANFQAPIFEGDINDESLICKLHECRPLTFLEVTAGIPCQGFSQQGDKLGMNDVRSSALAGITRCAWLLQADSVLLECVDNIIRFPVAQQFLENFAKEMKRTCHKLIFDLGDQWPMKRKRFWCLLMPEYLNMPALVPWPRTDKFTHLGSIMNLNVIWNDLAENELMWDDDEQRVYFDPQFGGDKRVLNTSDCAPTALHSWGHVCRPCSCGCRPAFSIQRLQQGGARGFGIVSALTSKPRHFHAEEASLLCTVLPSYQFPISPRSSLPLLGQIAAPLQVIWIQSQVLQCLQTFFEGDCKVDALANLTAYQHELINLAMCRWTTTEMFLPRELRVTIDELEIQVSTTTPVTVQDLTKAEQLLQACHDDVQVYLDGIALQPWALLHDHLPYQLRFTGAGTPDSAMGLSNSLVWKCMQFFFDCAFGRELTIPCFSLFPFKANDFLHNWIHTSVIEDWQQQYVTSSGQIILALESHGHWIILFATPDWGRTNKLDWIIFDGFDTNPWYEEIAAEACEVAMKLSALLLQPPGDFCRGHGLRQLHSHTCGTIAISHIAMILGFGTIPIEEILQMHTELLELQGSRSDFTALGIEDSFKALRALLADKGVPENATQDRAKLIMTKLGPSQVQQLLRNKNPWSALKAAASRPGHMFRLVLQDELAKQVAKRAQSQHGAAIKNHKNKKATKPLGPLKLDPDSFQLDDQYFQDEDGAPVPQIKFQEVGADQTGVALCDTQMAYPFLEQPKAISMEPLAILIMDSPPQEVIDSAGLQKITFPAYCPGTDEHTLVFGYVLQLGDKPVQRKFLGKASKQEIAQTQVIKLQIYKDQLQLDWQTFVQSPIRHLVAAMEPLQFCHGQNCGAECGKFHSGTDEPVDGVICEVWSRVFYDDNGHKTSPEKSSFFTAFIRVFTGATHRILTHAPQGVYPEPRGEKPREHDPKYRVIWLPGCGHAEAAHLSRTCTHSICLARMRQKFGVRVRQEDQSQAWAILRPGIDFVDMEMTTIYELFPLPHGTQRQALVKLLADWSWKARVLQPGSGNFSHMSWRVGASSPPPHRVMQGLGLEVVISQVKDLKKDSPEPRLIASSKTQKHLREQPKAMPASSSEEDPWQKYNQGPMSDPWARKGKPNVAAGSQSAAAGKSRLSEIRDQLCQDVKSTVRKELEEHATNMDTTEAADAHNEHESRFAALEVGLQEVQNQNKQFLQWFSDAGAKMKVNEQAIGEIQHTLNAHQQEISALGNTFQSSLTHVREDLSQAMTKGFSDQMGRLETLLKKRPAVDEPWLRQTGSKKWQSWRPGRSLLPIWLLTWMLLPWASSAFQT